ncbi:phospholipase [Streptomyces sp. NPDC002054]|uniref:phospholipase n=1 Tax=Streptomyces sp. NPDC002054 TaxID=3154663 RepID=UPI00332AE4C3
MRRPYVVVPALVALVAAFAAAAPAGAVPADKPQVLSRWTQVGAASEQEWLAARADRAGWVAYAFDWTTDHCSSSPDNPFGFPFQTACARHDFGYRNYRRAGAYEANKPRIDEAFHADLKRVCARYSGARKVSCDGTAWTYYRAVKAFGVSGKPDPRN